MLVTAILVFLVAAIGGLVMAVHIFRDRTPPMPLALLHGLLGATGLGLLIWLWLQNAVSPAVTVGLAILVVAALGGFFLFSFHLRGKPHPKAVVIVHALAAVCGVGALAFALL